MKLKMTEITVLSWLFKEPRRLDKIDAPMPLTLKSVIQIVDKLRQLDLIYGYPVRQRLYCKPRNIYKITETGKRELENGLKLLREQLNYLRSLR